MPTAADYKPFYDYSLIESGAQDYFVGQSDGYFVEPPDETDPTRESWSPGVGTVPFFTDFQVKIFQKHRPRVAASLSNIAPVGFQAQGKLINGQIRTVLWKAVLSLPIVTEASYAKHVALRSYVAAMAAEMAPMIPTGSNSTIGVNQYLTKHQIVKVEDAGQDTSVTPEDGYYTSMLNYNLTFCWRLDQLPS